MYNFIFYFFYRILAAKNRDEKIFTAILFTFIILGFHILTIYKIMVYFRLIGNILLFSPIYVHNKLYLSLLGLPIMIMVLLYFSKRRTETIIETKTSAGPFFTFKNISFFILIIFIPAIIFGLIPPTSKL